MKIEPIPLEEIQEYSRKYIRMRSFSVNKTDSWVADYDKRNDVLLQKFRNAILVMSGLSLFTKDMVELQCLRYLAMREQAARSESDGNNHIVLDVSNRRRITEARNSFDALADNPYANHANGIGEHFLHHSVFNQRKADQERRDKLKAIREAINK